LHKLLLRAQRAMSVVPGIGISGHTGAMPDLISLDEFVDGLDADRRTVEFLAPALSFESEPTSGDDVLGMFWRAYLMLQDADGLVGDPSIMVGQVDFILVPAGSAFASDQLRDLLTL